MTKGHCLCGAVSWKYSGKETWACYCHCDDCRRNCAAPVTAFICVRLDNFQWTGETFDNMKLGSVNKSKKTYNLVTALGKQKLLESIYGEIFDLTEENNKFVNITIIEPYIAKKIQETIGGFL